MLVALSSDVQSKEAAAATKVCTFEGMLVALSHVAAIGSRLQKVVALAVLNV